MKADHSTNARPVDIDVMSIDQEAVAKLKDAIVLHSKFNSCERALACPFIGVPNGFRKFFTSRRNMTCEVKVMAEPNQILWPTRYKLNCTVDVRNELEMSSSADAVWAWLIRAQLWPTWYPNSANMRFITGQPPDLALGTRFKWKTGFLNVDTGKASAPGLTVDCKVKEFLPPERLAYEFQGPGIKGYQAWLIKKTENGCCVHTEEKQRGLLARLLKSIGIPDRMVKQHQLWLALLRDNAAKGLPP